MLKFLDTLIGQEQGIAAQIVNVVICGNSVEIPRGILNGQVEVSQTMQLIYPVLIYLKYFAKIFFNERCSDFVITCE